MDTPTENGTSLTTLERLHIYASLLERASFARRAGLTFEGERDSYATLGYKRGLRYEDYRARYERGDIASRIIDTFPAATWRDVPTIQERDKDNETTATPFEEQWQALVERLRIYQVIERADRQACLGHYSVLLIGTRGDQDLASELPAVRSPDDILYLSAYSEEHVDIKALVADPNSPYFGMPALYEIDFNRGRTSFNDLFLTPSLAGMGLVKRRVHASRVIHIAENGLEDTVIGTPRLRAVWNRLDDLEKALGGSAEMYWQDAKRRIVLNLDSDAQMSAEDIARLDERVAEFEHQLRNFLKVQGMEVQMLIGSIADPSNVIEKQIDVIAGAVKIPKRKLIGTERGELASTQDENNFAASVVERQRHFGEPVILRPLIDRLIHMRALATPRQGYQVVWPDPMPPSEADRAEVALNWTKVFATYAGGGLSVEDVLPLEVFLNDVVGFSKEQVARITELIAVSMTEEQEGNDVHAEDDETSDSEDDEEVAP